MLIVSVTCMHVYGVSDVAEAQGPAPNSGDSVPDGSGYDRADWPNEDSPAIGPAPNAGDGVSDGSGF